MRSRGSLVARIGIRSIESKKPEAQREPRHRSEASSPAAAGRPRRRREPSVSVFIVTLIVITIVIVVVPMTGESFRELRIRFDQKLRSPFRPNEDRVRVEPDVGIGLHV